MAKPGGIARFLGRLVAPVILAALEEIDRGPRHQPVTIPARGGLRGIDPDVRTYLAARFAENMTIDAARHAAIAEFGERRVPKRSALGRYFKHLDDINGRPAEAPDERASAIASTIRQTVKDGLARGQFDSALKRTIRDQGESS